MGKLKFSLNGHSNWVESLAYLGSEINFLASGSYSGSIKLWNITNGRLVVDIDAANNGGHTNWITSLLALDDKGMFASGSLDTNIKIWKVTMEN